MCMDGISHVIMSDERIQQALSNPGLDLIHKQVLMALYSMEASGHLGQYRTLLPVYLSTDLARCEAILETLAQAGLVTKLGDGVELTYKVEAEQGDHSCGCHSH